MTARRTRLASVTLQTLTHAYCLQPYALQLIAAGLLYHPIL